MPSYALVGYPISHSLAPTFHNACFDLEGDPSRYELWSASRLSDRVLAWIRSEEFRGAAITMPLKATIIPHLDFITPESKLTGAVNTIVKIHTNNGVELVGTNTDYLGIVISLQTALLAHSPQRMISPTSFERGTVSAAVIGGGATTRSAILALHRLGLGPILLINRDEAEVQSTTEWFAATELVREEGLRLIHVRNPDEVDVAMEKEGMPPLGIIVGAIPAILPKTSAERRVYTTATHLFTLPRPIPSPIPASSPASHLSIPATPLFMDMAYYPRPTPLTQIAQALGWQTVDGMQSMIEQGFAQQRMWRAGDASVRAGTRSGVLRKETEDQVRVMMESVPDVKTDGREIDRADEV